jgi:hypothetical protein
MEKNLQKRQREAYTGSPIFIYTTYCKEYRGRKIFIGSYPSPLISKGERKNKSMREISEA